MRNIQNALEKNNIAFSAIENPRGRIIVYTEEKKSLNALRTVFGISSLSFATKINPHIKDMKEETIHLYREKARPNQTFRISSQRLDKGFPLTSQEVNATVGAYIVEKENAQVDLDNPGLDIGIEILHHAAYVFTGRIPAYGGIPVGVQGKVLVCLKDKRSAVAAWMMLKRGCELVVHGNEDLLPYLERFSYGHPILHVSTPKEAKGCLAAVLSDFQLKKKEIPSFYPLLGLNKQQIQEIEALIFEEPLNRT